MKTKTDNNFRIIAAAVIAVQTFCLLLVMGGHRLQSKNLQQMREELALERKYSRDLNGNLKAYEATYPEPAGVPQSETGVVTNRTCGATCPNR